MSVAAVGLDTSVVLRLLVGEPPHLFRRAVAFLDARLRAGDSIVVTDLVVAETYFALHHHYKVPKSTALGILRDFLESGEVQCQGQSLRVLRSPGPAKLGFFDRVVHAQYQALAAEMVTFERAARRLPGTRLI